jgi:hypothetical protein
VAADISASLDRLARRLPGHPAKWLGLNSPAAVVSASGPVRPGDPPAVPDAEVPEVSLPDAALPDANGIASEPPVDVEGRH